MRVFISYRRSDAPSASRQLAEALKLRFGAEEVFFDTRDVAAGDRVAKRRRAARAGVRRRPRDHRAALGAARPSARIAASWIPRSRTLCGWRSRPPSRTAGSSSRCSSTTPRCRPARRCRARSGRSPTSRRRYCATPLGNRDVEALADVLAHLAARFRPRRPPAERPHAGQAGRPHRRRADRVATSPRARSSRSSGPGPTPSTATARGSTAPDRCRTPPSWRATSRASSAWDPRPTTSPASRSTSR